MAEEDGVIIVDADLKPFVDKLKKVPGITDKEALKAAKAWEKRLKKAQIKSALQGGKSAKKVGSAWKNAAEAAKQAAEGIGGSLGGAAGTVEKFTRSVGEAGAAIGPVGIAAGIVTVTVAAMVAGVVIASQKIVTLIGDAEDLNDSLRAFQDAGVFEPVPPETLASIEAFNDNLDATRAAASQLTVELAGGLAVELGGYARALNIASFATRDMIEALGGMDTVAQVLVSGPFSLLVPNLREVKKAQNEGILTTLGLTDAVARWGKEAAAAAQVARDEKNAEEAESAAAKASAAAKRAQTAAERAQAQAMRESIKAIKDQQTARVKLRGITESANADTLTEEQKIQAAFDARVKAIAELQGAAASQGAASMALDEAEARRIRDLISLDAERAAAQRANDAKFIAARQASISAIDAEAAANIATTQSKNLATLASATELTNASIGLATELAQAQIDAQAEVAARAKSNIDSLKAARQEQAAEQKRLNESLLTDEQRIAKEEREAAAQIAKDKSGFSQAEIDATKAELKAKIRARKKNLRAARAAAKKTAKAQKRLARLGVVVNTAAAILKAFAQFGPPPSPAGISAAAAATLAGTTQLAVIGRQKPPQFHAGGTPAAPPSPQFTATPDEQIVSQLPGESTLNQRATQALGTEAIDALNQTGGGASGGVVINQNLDGRVINRAVQRGMERGTISLGDRGGPVGIQDVYGAG